MGLKGAGVRVAADHSVARRPGPWVTGANRADHHVSGVQAGRDFSVDEWGSWAVVAAGDPCPRCGGPLDLVRAVEAGHTFQLGLTYSSKIEGAKALDAEGNETPYWMGCYGIGLSRLVAVVAEACHDDKGLTWPGVVAPFQVHLIALAPSGGDPTVTGAAERLYGDLAAAGVSVLLDDRDVSAGVKFADADLLGMPLQVIVGRRGLGRGVVETKQRATGERAEVAVDAAAEVAVAAVSQL